MKKAIFWDYNFKKPTLKNPKIKIWYLERKLNFGDLKDITKKDLKKHLPELKINPSLKNLLSHYLKSNA